MIYFKNPKLEKPLANARVVIFDMNGLIIDDEPLQLQAYNAVLKKFKISLSKRYWQKMCLGRHGTEFVATIFKKYKIPTDRNLIFKTVQERTPIYHKLMLQKLKKITRHGALELINHIKKNRKQKLALATSSGPIDVQMTLTKTGLNIKNKFDFIINAQEVKLAKPNPEIYTRVAKHFKVKPQDCLVFEDGPIGVLAAHRAKMKVMAVPNKFTYKPKTYKKDFKHSKFILNSLLPTAKIL